MLSDSDRPDRGRAVHPLVGDMSVGVKHHSGVSIRAGAHSVCTAGQKFSYLNGMIIWAQYGIREFVTEKDFHLCTERTPTFSVNKTM